jgi:hypothetical protein
MCSQKVWAIEELVRFICSHTLEYRVQEYRQEREGHDGLVLEPKSRGTLAQCVLYLNRSIFRIAIEFLWKELVTLEPLCALLPLGYYQKVGHGASVYVSCLNRYTHYITFEPLDAIDIHEGRNARGFWPFLRILDARPISGNPREDRPR